MQLSYACFEDALGKFSVFVTSVRQAVLLLFHGIQWEILHWRIFLQSVKLLGRQRCHMPSEITVPHRHFYSTAYDSENMLDVHLCYIFHMCLFYIPFSVLKYSGCMKSCSHIDDRTREGRCCIKSV